MSVFGEPRCQLERRGWADAALRQRSVFGDLAGGRSREQVIDAGQLDELGRSRARTRARELRELLAVIAPALRGRASGA